MTTDMRPGPANSPLQILHLEDNTADATLVRETILDSGMDCRLTQVNSREAFVTALGNTRFNVILADYSLPGFSGSGAFTTAREWQPETPFIFVSGTIGEERAIEILKEGVTDYVLKNRLARLVPSIRRAVQEAWERERRRQTEYALLESEERFREMAENIREVFWSGSADGRQILYASPAYELIWSRPLSDLVHQPDSWLETVVPEDRNRVARGREQLAQGVPCAIEYRIARPDGSVRWIEEHGYPVCARHRHVVRTVGVALDITERKELQEQLQQSQKMEAVGQLAGGIAHDFNNLLTVINGYSNLLLDNPAVTPAMAELLKQVYVAGGRAASLTRQLLIFSHKNQAQSQSLDLNELIGETSPLLQRMIGEQIKLTLDLGRPLPRTLADANMIEQVIMNLVVNARDAMAGGGSLVISTGSGETSAEENQRNPQARPGPHVWLSVRDTGSGIPPEILPRIFEPFFTTKEVGKGTGLGLATVFGIARQHKGWVEVESEMGVGTLFKVFLPVTAAEAPVPNPTVETSRLQVPGGKEMVLLVEDEFSVREYARTVLEMQGYKVLQATTSAEALEAWKWHRDRIALLLTDVVLPDEMSGMELAAKLQAERPGLKVIYASGYNPEATGEPAPERARMNFLHKPYQPKTLARMVREVLDRGYATAGSSQVPFG